MNAPGLAKVQALLDAAAAEGRDSLLEHEIYEVLAAVGCSVPRRAIVRPGQRVASGLLQELGGERVILKIVSPHIAHKTDVGGVRKVAAEPAVVDAAIQEMLEQVPRRFAARLAGDMGHAPEAWRGLEGRALEEAVRADLLGVMVAELVPCEGEGIGSEAIFALRHNREFGPVLTMGIGGIDTEMMAEACRKGLAAVSASAHASEQSLLDVFRATLAYRRLAGRTRTGERLVEDEALLRLLGAFRALATGFGSDGPGDGWTLTELEVNPFAASGGRLVALDGILRFRRRQALPRPRPLASLGPMLEPKSLAMIGVSAKGQNMGRIILGNILESGFPRERVYVVRPETDAIDGVRCVPTVKDLPERVDLFIVAVGAEQVPELMEELVEHDKAIGVILIPGGMAEKAGGEVHEARLKAALAKARDLNRPLIANGGNCLGIVSRPGRYHTLFIPKNKMTLRDGGLGRVAFISQSGAYMISRMSKLDGLAPRYAISTGNQADLTVSDFVRHLAGDPEVRTFAVYVEGFKDGDGATFAKAVEEVTRSGKDVIFYKAGRTAEGKSATSGHTASLAGDYDVCEAVVRQAGAVVARDFGEFLDLLKISALLGSRRWGGRRLAALSNAGYEAVGIADSLRGDGFQLQLAPLGTRTRARLQEALTRGKLDGLVDPRNPLDVTPMAGDEAHEEAMRIFLEDPDVDLALCSTVPLTPTMATLADGVPEEQSIRAPGSLPNRLGRLLRETDKPLAASIDSGSLFDPMARAIEAAGIPCFRSVDAAVRTLGIYCQARLSNAARRV